MSYFNIVCDSCGRGVQGITWVNGMKFCAKCYQETFGNNTSKFVDLLNTEMYELKISNLEHKLKEKDQRIAELEEQLKKSRIKYFIGLDGIDFDWCVKELDLNIILPKWMHDNDFKFYDTKEEALAKLEELKGE